jgi:hypothetical protein
MKKTGILFLPLVIILQFFFVLTAYSQKNDKFLLSRQAIPNRFIVVLNDENDMRRTFPDNAVGMKKSAELPGTCLLFMADRLTANITGRLKAMR